MIEYIFDFKVIILICISYLIYRFGTRKHNLHVRFGFSGPRPLPFIGNMFSTIKMGMHEFDKQCRDKYGKIYLSYFGGIPLVMVSDDELLKQILMKDFKCFTDRLDVGIESKNTENMLTGLKGKDWERVRNLVTPAFTSGKLKKMSPLLIQSVELLMSRLRDRPAKSHLDMKEFFGALTMDAIARTMFGMEIDSQKNPKNPFIVSAEKIFEVSFSNPILFLVLMFPSLAKLIRKIYPDWEPLGYDALKFLTTNIEKAIEKRKTSIEPYNDFLALMLNARRDQEADKRGNGDCEDMKFLSPLEISAQVLIFLVAGYETTATTMTFLSYFLAKNPSIQRELYDELIDVVGVEGEISYEALSKMTLLDGAINETLRLCPPINRFERECTQDVDLVTSDQRIIHAKKGDIFSVPIYAIHTDPSIWPDPNTFDIHRFDRDQKKDRSAYAHMPFGMGPRNCVGMRFALLEIKWALASIVQEFEIVACDKTPETIQFKSVRFSQPVHPIIVTIQRREQ